MKRIWCALAACLIAASAAAQSPSALQADAIARAHPIASLSSDDFGDLQFLKPLLAGKRLVQLGESGHGVSEFSTMKVRLIKFLHQQMGYDVIAFESSLAQCDSAERMIGKAAPEQVMKSCAFGVWHSSETLALFDYLDSVRKAGGKLTLTGFDTQFSTALRKADTERLTALLTTATWPRASEFAAKEKQLLALSVGKPMADADAAALSAYFTEMGEVLQQQRQTLQAAAVPAAEIDMAIQTARSLFNQTQMKATGKDADAGNAVRDAGMAKNIDFLLDQAYPQRKIVVWAHNAHINYERTGPKRMGAYIAERHKAQTYTIGLFMGHGTAGTNGHHRYDIAPPPPATFEALLAGVGSPMSFVDFSTAPRTASTAWIFQPVELRDWGTRPLTQTPGAAYDGVLYIDTVKLPDYR